MAKENVTQRLTFDVLATGTGNLAYDKDEPYGNANAGKDLAVALNSSSKLKLATTDDVIIGKLEEVHADGRAAVSVKGVMIFKQGTASGCVVGRGVVGAQGASSADGHVDSPGEVAATYGQEVADDIARQRGTVLRVISNTQGGDVEVLL